MSFEAKATQAARALKSRMGLPEAPVESGANYATAAPPPGSYAAMQHEQQQQNEQAEELARIRPLEGEPPQQTPQRAVADPGQAPQMPQAQPELEPTLSDRARTRIETLAREKNEFARQVQQAAEDRARLEQQNQQLAQQLEQLQRQFQEMMQANLDHLDPEDRTRVMTEASARQAADTAAQQLMGQIQPLVAELRDNQFQMQLTSLASRYPAFDYEKHAGAIRATMQRNSSLTVEQAFRVVADDEELGIQGTSQVPPVLAPRSSRGTEVVAPPPPRDPNLDLIEERNQWREMSHSTDPEVRKRADKLLQQHLSKRLGLSRNG